MAEIKKNVLIHSLVFPPDQVSTSYLYGDIAQKLVMEGYELEVITTWPHYNYNENFKDKSNFGFFFRRTDYHGAKVYHIKQSKDGSIAKRFLYIMYFHFLFLFKALTLKKIDLIITPSPPLTSGLLSGIVAKIRNAKSIYNVQEIYPDVILKQGKIKSEFIIHLLKKIESTTYSLANKVITIDERFSKTIKDRLIDEKLITIPNFIDTQLYKPFEGEYPADLVFENKFIVGYIGNLGKVQNWNAVLKAAENLVEINEIHFLIIGGGTEYERLVSECESRKNITVWHYQKRERVPMINSRINLHLISMSNASDYDGLPSKVFAILSSARPVLAATNCDSPLANIVKNSKLGVVVKRDSSDAIVEGIKSIYTNYYSDLELESGREFILKNYSKEIITQKYADIISELL